MWENNQSIAFSTLAFQLKNVRKLNRYNRKVCLISKACIREAEMNKADRKCLKGIIGHLILLHFTLLQFKDLFKYPLFTIFRKET